MSITRTYDDQPGFAPHMKSVRELLRRRAMWQAHAQGVTRLPYPPLEVWVEPTSHCNLKCVKCPHAVGLKRSKGFMETALYRQVIDEISDYAFTVSLHLGGESLIHKELPDQVAYAAERGLRTVLHTNATLVTEAKSEALIRAGLSVISFSMDGEDKETYEAIDAGGKFEKAMGGVRTFMATKQRLGKGPYTVVQMLSPDPEGVKLASSGGLLDLGADYLKLGTFHAWSGEFSHNDDAPVPSRGFEALRADEDQYSPCNNLWYGISVFWDGNVVPCCMDMEGEYPVGSVKDSSVLDLWNSDRMVDLRTALVERKHADQSLCRDCAYLWGKSPGSAWADARGMVKQAVRSRPRLAKALGVRPWGTHGWNG